jgi:hypothetical protein
MGGILLAQRLWGGNNQSFRLVNVQRREPDPSFEIPPDYRVLERVEETPARTGVGAAGSVRPSVTQPTTPPSKP